MVVLNKINTILNQKNSRGLYLIQMLSHIVVNVVFNVGYSYKISLKCLK